MTRHEMISRIPPPIGPTPRFIHDARRARALAEAIVRCLERGLRINLEWVEEYNEIIAREEEKEV